MLKYALTGNPLGHSLSPIIHEEILKIKNKEGTYVLKQAENLDKSFNEELSELDGFNVTIPYKKDIIKYLDFASDKVKLYNSCNTVKIEDGVAKGYNTDVFGILDTLKKNNIDVCGKKVLVLGNGGVSSLIACEMALLGGEVYISSRNKDKAETLINDIFRKTGKKVTFIEKENVEKFDICFNGTPLGMYPKNMAAYLPLAKLKNIAVFFDTIYNPYKTLSVRVSEYFGNKGIGGLNMLVEQAVKAQEIFNKITLTKSEFNRVLNKAKDNIPEFKVDKNIILIGAPGSGKSVISREISNLLNMNLVDIDSEIVRKEKRAINEIFEKNGEEYFRGVEREIFYEKIKTTGNVIATGGGLPEFNDLKNIDKEKNIVVFINVDKDVIYNRISHDETRPLLKNNKKEALISLIKRRSPIYKEACDIKINVEKERDMEEIVIEILEKSLSL